MKSGSMQNPETVAIGIDLGGTKTEAILLASNGTLLWRQRRPTNRSDGYDAVLSIVAEMIDAAAAQLPHGTNYTVGIGMPGSLDATVRAAFDLGFACTIAQDACAAPDLAFNGETIPARQVHGSFLAALGAVYAKIRTSDDILEGISAGRG